MPYQSNNPYFVAPPDHTKAFQGISNALTGRADARREQVEEQRKQGIRQDLAQNLEEENYEGIYKTMAVEPWVVDEFKKVDKFKNDRTKKARGDAATEIVLGGKATTAIAKLVGVITDENGTVEDTAVIGNYAMQADKAEAIGDAEGKAKWDKKVMDAAELEYAKMFDVDKMLRARKARGGGEDEKPILRDYSKVGPKGGISTIRDIRPDSKREARLLKDGWSEGTKTGGYKSTGTERRDAKILESVDRLSAEAKTDPEKFFHKYNYRMNDDGTLFLDAQYMPTKLETFTQVTGKRGTVKVMKKLGEQWDDANELNELLTLPTVKAKLSKARREGLWDQAKGKWNNSIKKWMQDKGISGDSPTATAIARIQRMASDERKLYMGTAVTDSELKSATAWMPSAGDSYETMINKTNLMGHEAEQEFRRWIDIFSKNADMSPFYKAFGMKRFNEVERDIDTDSSMDRALPMAQGDIPDGSTATGANGQKIIKRQGKWGSM